jgi:hypothetical protein
MDWRILMIDYGSCIEMPAQKKSAIAMYQLPSACLISLRSSLPLGTKRSKKTLCMENNDEFLALRCWGLLSPSPTLSG